MSTPPAVVALIEPPSGSDWAYAGLTYVPLCVDVPHTSWYGNPLSPFDPARWNVDKDSASVLNV